jgi:hypothetical protein
MQLIEKDVFQWGKRIFFQCFLRELELLLDTHDPLIADTDILSKPLALHSQMTFPYWI